MSNLLERIAESRIGAAIEAGEFERLAGSGAPLELDDLTHVPEAWRPAFLLLQRSGLAADWLRGPGRNPDGLRGGANGVPGRRRVGLLHCAQRGRSG